MSGEIKEKKAKNERGLKLMPDGRWRISYMTPGRHYHREIVGRSKSEARKLLEQIHTELRQGTYKDKDKCREVPFEEAVELFLKWSKSNKRKATFKLDQLCTQSFLECPYFRGRTLQMITGGDIEKYKQDLLAGKNKNRTNSNGQPLKPRTIDIHLSRLKRLFSLCQEWELCERNPALKISLLNIDNKRERRLSPEEEHILMESATPKLRKLIQFALHTGMRLGEILGMRWSEIDFKEPSVVIPVERAKGKRKRIVPLNADALSIIKSFPRPIKGDAIVFENDEGGVWGRWRIHWDKAIRKSGIENLHFHDLRHEAACRWREEGADLIEIGQLLGHTSYQITLRYVHVAPASLKKVVASTESRSSIEKLQTSCNREGDAYPPKETAIVSD